MSAAHAGLAHPVFIAAGATVSLAAALQDNIITILAVPSAIYFAILIIKELLLAPAGWLGTLIAKVQSMWAADKPYITILVIGAFAAAQYMNVPIPPWAMTVAAGLGIAPLVHSLTKGKSVP